MSSKLFAFSRPLPAPFDKAKKKVKVSSKYGDGTEATLCSTVVKAVQAYFKCKDGSEPGAVGLCGTKGVAEYKSASGPEVYHLAIYDPAGGAMLASIYNKDTEMLETYAVRNNGQDGAAIMMSMLPALMADDEFRENLDALEIQYQGGYPDMGEATERMAILCDNAYRRINDSSCAAHLPTSIDGTGNVMRVSTTHIDSGNFRPDTVVAGMFTILANSTVPEKLEIKPATPHSDFVGKYVLDTTRVLTPFEQSLVPVLAPWYVLPEEVVTICKHAKQSTGKALPMRNFLLRGPAGTGKTEGARAIAAGLNLPYMKYTCSAGTEIYDLIGQVFPDTDGPSTGDVELDQQRAQLKEMGGITYENVKKLMGLPDLDDMDYDPAGTYQKLTGVEKADATSQDCMGLVMEMVTDKLQQLCKVKPESADGRQTFTYIETDFMNLTQDIELPAPEIMAQRAMSITGCEDDVLVGRMVQVVTAMADYCRKNGISDGNCGMRSLIDWIMSTEITGDPYSSALYTIVSKATSDEEDRDALITTVLEPIFAPKRKRAV